MAGEKDSEPTAFQGLLALLLLIVSLPVLVVVAVVNAFRDPKAEQLKKDLEETRALHDEVVRAIAASPIGSDSTDDLVGEFIFDACMATGRVPTAAVLQVLAALVEDFMTDEGLSSVPHIDWSKPLGLEEGVVLRNRLRAQKRLFANFDRRFAIWRATVGSILIQIITCLPDTALADVEDQNEPEASYTSLDVALIDLIDRPAILVEALIASLFESEVTGAELFERARQQLDDNCYRASGINPSAKHTTSKALILPTEAHGKSPRQLAELYLRGTAFERLLSCELSFDIPDQVRFEHCHVIGGTGHGKTQLLQFLAHRDLKAATVDGRAVVVIDSQGDLLNTLIRRSYFDPATKGGLADRLVLIDPTDIEHPPALNLFDVNMERIEGFGALEREQVLNGTIELYEYLFGALLGAELTAKQGVIFKYVARLMLTIPGANLPTLLSLMEDPEPFRPHVEALGGTARRFFETEFYSSRFAATRRQVARRLWSVLSLPTFERLFSQPHNKLDLFQAMNDGKIIFINTAKDLLKQEGCTIFGRFFIAMIAQAALQRAAIAPASRRPTFVYIDEAQEYFDESVGQLLAQARKFNVGMTLAHQNLDQVGSTLRAGIMANTSVKLAGGVSAKDASALAPELRCSSEFLQDMRKHRDRTEFACHVKDATLQAVRLSVPLGAVSAEPGIDDAAYATLIDQNRRRYSASMEREPAPLMVPVRPVPPAAPMALLERERVPLEDTEAETSVDDTAAPVKIAEPVAPRERMPGALGRGGREHTYLQALITQVAQDHGYRATIEQPVGDGSGSVDVVLERGEVSIACEISVSTTHEQELQNVTKCLAAGFEQVLLVAPKARHLKHLETQIVPRLSGEEMERVRFLSPDGAVALLSEDADPTKTGGAQTVRGYRVRVSQAPVDPKEVEARRKAVAGVILRSMKRLSE